jgi:hypothetical protein
VAQPTQCDTCTHKDSPALRERWAACYSVGGRMLYEQGPCKHGYGEYWCYCQPKDACNNACLPGTRCVNGRCELVPQQQQPTTQNAGNNCANKAKPTSACSGTWKCAQIGKYCQWYCDDGNGWCVGGPPAFAPANRCRSNTDCANGQTCHIPQTTRCVKAPWDKCVDGVGAYHDPCPQGQWCGVAPRPVSCCDQTCNTILIGGRLQRVSDCSQYCTDTQTGQGGGGGGGGTTGGGAGGTTGGGGGTGGSGGGQQGSCGYGPNACSFGLTMEPCTQNLDCRTYQDGRCCPPAGSSATAAGGGGAGATGGGGAFSFAPRLPTGQHQQQRPPTTPPATFAGSAQQQRGSGSPPPPSPFQNLFRLAPAARAFTLPQPPKQQNKENYR